jgi:hypothetical protein
VLPFDGPTEFIKPLDQSALSPDRYFQNLIPLAASTISQLPSRQRRADTALPPRQARLAATTLCSAKALGSSNSLLRPDIHPQSRLLRQDFYASSMSKPSSCLPPSRPPPGQTADTRRTIAKAFPSQAENVYARISCYEIL